MGIPFTFSATLKVEKGGHNQLIATEPSTPELAAWFESQLRKWSISPGDRAPTKTGDQLLHLVVRVDSAVRDQHPHQESSPRLIGSHPAIFVDIRLSPVNGRSVVMIGGMVASQNAMDE
jgi:hypothetical protein